MNIEFTITAKNKGLFNIKLTERLMKVFNDIDIVNSIPMTELTYMKVSII